MIHFLKRAKIHLDVFTANRSVMEYAAVVNAMEVVPEWWKKLPKQTFLPNSFFPSSTMKTCAGLQDYYARSVAIPLWSELYVSVFNGNYEWQFSDSTTQGIVHGEHQYEGYLTSSPYGHLKIESPWVFTTKQNIDWLLTDPIYSRENLSSYTVTPGILNFSKQIGTNLQLFIDLSKNHTFNIPFRTPFMFTPLSDKEIVIHRHLLDNEKMNSLKQKFTTVTFTNKYRATLKASKCPFKDHVFKE